MAAEAREGFELARQLLPDCIVCDVLLPDIDGFWVARRVRGERSRLATTPFAFLTKEDNPELRLQGLAFGADVFISPPFRHEEVVAQVTALVGMAERIRAKTHDGRSLLDGGEIEALRGDLAQLSVTTLLAMLEMERRTGRLRVKPPQAKEMVFLLVDGTIAAAELDGESEEPLALMRRVVSLSRGSFAFEPVEATKRLERGRPVGALLLEATRLNDEAAR